MFAGSPRLLKRARLVDLRVAGPRMAAYNNGLIAYSHVQAKQIVFISSQNRILTFAHNRSLGAEAYRFIKALRWIPPSRLEGEENGDSPEANQLVVLTSHLCSHKDNPSTSETSSDATKRWM